jgi:hypothetical protein
MGRIAMDNMNELGSSWPAPQMFENDSISGRMNNYSKRSEYFAQLGKLNKFERRMHFHSVRS